MIYKILAMQEKERIYDSIDEKVPPWRKWGAYVSERAWGTVREDYSATGDAWNYFPHDAARSRAYRWSEDGLAGWCDRHQYLVFSFAFWNGKDPILKERLFGLTPFEGNHGEDVKEYYFYLDGTPTHSYMKYLYKYPQAAFPYDELVRENKARTTRDREFELVDTGVFKEDRYFDIYIEYAKASPEDTVIRLEVCNRGDAPSSIHILPQLLFRNTWSNVIPTIEQKSSTCLVADPTKLPLPDWLSYDYHLPLYYFYGEEGAEALFTNNETGRKDAFHRYVIHGEKSAQKQGTKACFYYSEIQIPAKGSRVFHFRLTSTPGSLDDVDEIIALRKKEADAFYASIAPPKLSDEDRAIQRSAFAGMIWSTQYYHYDVKTWLEGGDSARYRLRNAHWEHLHAGDLICMPDKWEYPWFASWDMAFHAITLSEIDLPLAKQQLRLFLLNRYQHPNGQIPAYEWNFSDTNPPVQAWALFHLYRTEFEESGREDFDYLEYCFLTLMNNFSGWVNKVDRLGNNIFEGGFLGLDNISIVDRSVPLPGGGFFEQSDATGWMGFFSLIMMRLALILSKRQPLFQRIAFIYFEQFVGIATAMQGTKARSINLWDETDGFFYDVVAYPNGFHEQLKVRSFVGLIPFFSLEFLSLSELETHPDFYQKFQLYLQHFPELVGRCITHLPDKNGYLFSLMTPPEMKRVLSYVENPDEFFSPFGLRSLSKYHQDHPFNFNGSIVAYEPGESLEKIKGGNSNWRGPIWFPINYLFYHSLGRLNAVLADPHLHELQSFLRTNLISLFRKDKNGRRPVHGDNPLFEDLILFYEHYHGETGRGLGASHQTGWSGLVANLIGDS